MSASLLDNKSNIAIEVIAEKLDIDADRAVPFGLLVNELVTNAIKHAFPSGTGRIVLSATRAGGAPTFAKASEILRAVVPKSSPTTRHFRRCDSMARIASSDVESLRT